jgi:hypothetical protein
MLLWARKNGCPCGETELHLAALKGLEALVRALIEAGAADIMVTGLGFNG